MAADQDLYRRLGVNVDASAEEIRRAYREAARRLHPDRNTAPGETEMFLGIQEAFDVLSNPEKRREYDATLPAETYNRPVTVNLQYSRSALHFSDEPQLLYVLLDIAAQKGASRPLAATPLNVCLIIDSSTSMQGILMDTVKSTAIELVRQLRPEDILSIVSFSDRAEVILPAGKRLETSQIEAGIQMLHSRGGTEIFRGLDAGYNEVCRFRDANHVNHMILITDGRTYGDEAECLRIAQQAALQGVGISSLGIGEQWNDQFLDKLASMTGGSTQYVTSARSIRDYLKDKFTNFSSQYADHVTYHFSIDPKVHIRYAFRLHPDLSILDGSSPLTLGSVPREGSLSILMELLIDSAPRDANQIVLADGRLVMDVPFRRASQFTMHLTLSCPCTEEGDLEPPPQAIVQAMLKLTLYRMQERARQDVADGRIAEATRHLQNIATHLIAQGNTELARTIMTEISFIEQNQTYSEAGGKRIKYGTRGLLLPPGMLESKRE